MEYLLVILGIFIGTLFFTQVIFFEIGRRKMKEAKNIAWFLSLDRPFQYRRVGQMIFVSLICYAITSPEEIFSLSWFVYFVLFLAISVVSDILTQYFILIYAKKRCHKEIQEGHALKDELVQLSENLTLDYSYVESPAQYDEKIVLQNYVQPQDHIAILSTDEGEFARSYAPLPAATFVIEPYSDIELIKAKFHSDQVKVTKLSASGQLPFKDDKMDVVMCQLCSYQKEEVQRVLKQNGYFIVNQNGTTNLKEFIELYMPFQMKGSWDAYSCAESLKTLGMKIVDKMEDYGSIRFHSIQALYQYFLKVSPSSADIDKYQSFYLIALKEIKERSYFEMTTHKFLVVAQKV